MSKTRQKETTPIAYRMNQALIDWLEESKRRWLYASEREIREENSGGKASRNSRPRENEKRKGKRKLPDT